jgi:hypothetical protein
MPLVDEVGSVDEMINCSSGDKLCLGRRCPRSRHLALTRLGPAPIPHMRGILVVCGGGEQ